MADETLPTGSEPPSPFPSTIPDSVGPFRILQQIGEGGFGVVYEAEQTAPVRRRVALKVIKPGMDSKQVLARFDAEKQALAVMNHPCIARVFDGGVTERALPYFVMELVKGDPITDFCDTNRLTIEQRVELMIHVCEAVQHAHTKGVVHRDIKPSNILVAYDGNGRAQPKVIDFGIAKALNQRLTEATIFTERGQLIGTPEYMSPEQAEMGSQDIDTRADVYSLGVLLYELLTGAVPFDSKSLRAAGFAEIQRIIREVEPPRPSTRLSTLLTADAAYGPRLATARRLETRALRRLLQRDLDWVVMKCLDKNRERRYDTANALAMELRRFLDDEPVLAGPPSPIYRLQKLASRNRGPILAAALLLAVLAAGAIVSTTGWMRALKNQRQAQDALIDLVRHGLQSSSDQSIRDLADAANIRLQLAENDGNKRFWIDFESGRQVPQLAAFAQQVFLALDNARDNEATRAAQLQQAADFQATQLASLDPTTMGVALRRGLIEKVRAAAERADASKEQAAERVNQFQALLAGADFTGLALDSLEDNLFRNTIDAIDTQFAEQPLVRARLLQSTASLTRELGLLELASDPQGRALEIRREKLGDDHPDTLTSSIDAGALLYDMGETDKAESLISETLETARRSLGNEHTQTIRAVTLMGIILRHQGRFEEAEPFDREALATTRRTLGDDHPATLHAINSVAILLQNQGRFDEAEPRLREVLETRRRVLGSDHPDTLLSISNMGSLLNEQGRPEEAEPYYRETLDRSRRTLGDDHPDTLTAISKMGVFLEGQGRLDEAEPLNRQALEGYSRTLGDEHPDTLNAISNLAVLLQRQGKLDEADTYSRHVIETRRRVLGDDHPLTLISISNRVLLLCELDQGEQALTLAQEAIERGRTTLGENHWVIGNFLGKRARAFRALHRYEEAERDMLDAHHRLSTALGNEHVQTTRIVAALADLYDEWHTAEPKAGHDTKAATWQAKQDTTNTEAALPNE